MRQGTPNRKGTPILSDCCPSPFGYINDCRFIIYGKHDRETHLLSLSPEDLRKLADLIESNRVSIEPSERAA
jgi:hypothetical protein